MGRELDASMPGWPRAMVTGRSMYYDMAEQPCTFGRWAEQFERKAQPVEPGVVPLWRIGYTTKAHVTVSTVWLGMDHSFLSYGPPRIYESLVFGGPCDGNMDRYSTRAEAEAGHERMVHETFRWWRNPEYRILAAMVAPAAVAMGLLAWLR